MKGANNIFCHAAEERHWTIIFANLASLETQWRMSSILRKQLCSKNVVRTCHSFQEPSSTFQIHAMGLVRILWLCKGNKLTESVEYQWKYTWSFLFWKFAIANNNIGFFWHYFNFALCSTCKSEKRELFFTQPLCEGFRKSSWFHRNIANRWMIFFLSTCARLDESATGVYT